MPETSERMPCSDNWTIPDNIQRYTFDFSWEPNPNEPATMHEFALNIRRRAALSTQ